MHRTDVAIIGAGQAGLAMSACLQARGICGGDPYLHRVRGVEGGWVGPSPELALEQQAGRGDLAQVAPGPCLDETQFGCLFNAGRLSHGLRDQPEGDLGPAERPFAVGEHGAVARVPAHAAVRPEPCARDKLCRILWEAVLKIWILFSRARAAQYL